LRLSYLGGRRGDWGTASTPTLWWIVFSTIVLGVGIGVLAQPQLVVRFMTVKSKRELNRAVVVAVVLSYYFRGGTKGFYIVARATAIFFGLCASAFLPAFIGGLFFKRMTRVGAIASIIAGFVTSLFWLLFIKQKEAGDIGLVTWLTGQRSLVPNAITWVELDPLVVALPVSIVVATLVSLLTRPPGEAHLKTCFE
jgi:Na+/proline symporter